MCAWLPIFSPVGGHGQLLCYVRGRGWRAGCDERMRVRAGERAFGVWSPLEKADLLREPGALPNHVPLPHPRPLPFPFPPFQVGRAAMGGRGFLVLDRAVEGAPEHRHEVEFCTQSSAFQLRSWGRVRKDSLLFSAAHIHGPPAGSITRYDFGLVGPSPSSLLLSSFAASLLALCRSTVSGGLTTLFAALRCCGPPRPPPPPPLVRTSQVRFTALHGAINHGQHEVAILLLERGANPQVRMEGTRVMR